MEAEFEAIVENINQHQRGVVCDLWGWCQKASDQLIENTSLTEMGIRVLRTMLVLFLKHSDQLTPPLLQWLKSTVVPALVNQQSPQAELLGCLLEVLFQHLLRRQLEEQESGGGLTNDKAKKRRRAGKTGPDWLKGDDDLLDRALTRWREDDTADNTTPRGCLLAREVASDFVRWWWPAQQPGLVVPERCIYDWIAGVCQRPCFRTSGRQNRALPQRVVRAILCELHYPRLRNIQETRDRAVCGISLTQWLDELRLVMGRAEQHSLEEDARLVWAAYEVEAQRMHSNKTRREKWRVFQLFLRHRYHFQLPTDTIVDVPAAFLDPSNNIIDPYVRFFCCVRWTDHAGLLAHLFRPMMQYTLGCRNRRHAAIMRAYVRPMYHLCVAFAASGTCTEPLLPRLEAASRLECIRAIMAVSHERGRCIKLVYQLSHGVWSHLLPRWRDWVQPITRADVGHRPQKRCRLRDRFTEEEVARLRDEAAKDPVDFAMFVFLLHTGCRSGALCNLLVEDVAQTNHPCVVVRSVGRVLEKGGVRRDFLIDPIMRTALERALPFNRGSLYVFPAPRGIKKRTIAHNDAWIRGLCQRCGIHGDHVHMHAIRRTTISLLLDAGNPLATVSQWIGHQTFQMTQHYWEPELATGGGGKNMRIPWLPEQPAEKKDTEELLLAAFERVLAQNEELRRQLRHHTQCEGVACS